MEDINSPESALKETKTCPHCRKEISIQAKRCPYCQADLRNWPNRHPFLSFILFLICGVLILSLVGSAISSSSSENGSNVSTGSASSTSPQASSSQQAVNPAQPNVATGQSVPDTSNTSATAAQSPGFVSPTTASFGQETEIFQGVYVIVGHAQDFTSTNFYQQPQTGNKFVSIYVSFENKSAHSFDYNSLDLSVVDPAGASYAGEAVSTESPALNSGTINPGNQATGYVLFEVPASETTSQLIVHGVFGGISGTYLYSPNAVIDFK